jgi:putative hemolysin
LKTKASFLGYVLVSSVLILGACCRSKVQDAGPANPASVYCQEQGYVLEMRTDADSGTYGVCIFPDGSECEEWAFYRGECGPEVEAGGAQSADEPTSTPAPEVWVNPAKLAGLDGTVEIEILELNTAAATGYVHRLTVSDASVIARVVSALDVDLKLGPRVRCPAAYKLRFRLADGVVQEFGLGCDAENPAFVRGGQDFWQGQDAEPPAQFVALIQEQLAAAPDETPVVGWYGYVVSLPAGSEYDDYLYLEPGGAAELGVTGADEEIEAQIVALRDKEEPGKYAHFWGTLTCGVPDYNGCQVVVTKLRVDGPGEFFPPDPVEGWEGIVVGNPPMSEYDDHFVLSAEFFVIYGIDSSDPDIAAQLEDLRYTMTPIRVWGEVTCGVPDTNGCRIDVTRIEIAGEPLALDGGG